MLSWAIYVLFYVSLSYNKGPPPKKKPRNRNWEMQTEHYNVGMCGPFCTVI